MYLAAETQVTASRGAHNSAATRQHQQSQQDIPFVLQKPRRYRKLRAKHKAVSTKERGIFKRRCFYSCSNSKTLIIRKAASGESRDWERYVTIDRKLPAQRATSAFTAKAEPASCEYFYPGMGGTLCFQLCGNLGNVVCQVASLSHGFP